MLFFVILFAILAIVFGFWGFGAGAAVAWAGAQILFWVFLVLFVISLLGGWSTGWGRPRRPLP
jgi:uncharacterized membrane protein YtjA (UPF0391 family)